MTRTRRANLAVGMRPCLAVVIAAVVSGGFAGGCRRAAVDAEVGRDVDVPLSTTNPTTSPAAVEFVSRGHGIRLAYPAGWAERPTDGYVLGLSAPGGAAAVMSLDVPDLPPHIPGWIPLGMVVKGYLDDLRERFPGLRIDRSVATTLAGEKARRVRVTWPAADGTPHVEEAVLTTHGDRVYILRLTVAAHDHAGARAAYEDVLRSVAWVD